MLYYLGLGSNQNAETNMQRMLELTCKQFGDVLVSSIVKTEAEGERASDYLNTVVCFRSEWLPERLNVWCKKQEDKLGRRRGTLNCCADMDILQQVNHPAEVSLIAVKEVFFQPLVKQLVSLQSDSQPDSQDQTVRIRLASGIELGNKPRHIKTETLEPV